jgi:S1/P1 nuclease
MVRVKKELAFPMHLAGDIHQPPHCVSDADAGGNGMNVVGFDPMTNLHAVWDVTLVKSKTSRLNLSVWPSRRCMAQPARVCRCSPGPSKCSLEIAPPKRRKAAIYAD